MIWHYSPSDAAFFSMFVIKNACAIRTYEQLYYYISGLAFATTINGNNIIITNMVFSQEWRLYTYNKAYCLLQVYCHTHKCRSLVHMEADGFLCRTTFQWALICCCLCGMGMMDRSVIDCTVCAVTMLKVCNIRIAQRQMATRNHRLREWFIRNNRTNQRL